MKTREFLGQFVVCPSATNVDLPGFVSTKFKDKTIYSHPHLPVKVTGNRALIGFAFGDLADVTYLEGRFVLLVAADDGLECYNDPCGLRPVVYTDDGFLASSTAILQRAKSITASPDYDAYFASDYVRNTLEHFLPSGVTLFEGVHHLVPNHYLKNGKQVRFWPTRAIDPIPVDEAAIRISEHLTAAIGTAAERFPLSLPMTAGWDSRLLLACSRGVMNQVAYYTLRYRDLTTSSPDLRIPKTMLERYDLQYRVIDCTKQPDPDYVAIYQANTIPSHLNDWGVIAYGISHSLLGGRVCLKGNCAEIVRLPYYRSIPRQFPPTVERLVATEKGWEELPFIAEAVGKWAEEAVPVCEAVGLNVFDLFYWEHRMGSWQAQSQMEWSIAQDCFTPYNSRRFLELALATPDASRSPKDFTLFAKAIRHAWPEMARYPINPISLRERVIKKVKRMLKA